MFLPRIFRAIETWEDNNTGLDKINQIRVRNFEYKTKDDLADIEADGLVETDIIENNKRGHITIPPDLNKLINLSLKLNL